MAHEAPVKALVLAFTGDVAAAVYVINRYQPDSLCLVLPDAQKAVVESAMPPRIDRMPRRWDWVTQADADEVGAWHRTLVQALPALLATWAVQPGELVVDLTGATPAMAAALVLVTLPAGSRTISLVPWTEAGGEEAIELEGRQVSSIQVNLWDDVATVSRGQAAALFNRGLFAAAVQAFREIEVRVSGGQKPTYRAFADLADGYALWDSLHYRHAWDKLKTSAKALELASVWGGPPGVKALLPAIKANVGFLERLVLDAAPVKEVLPLDLLAQAGRRLHVAHDPETGMRAVLRALEAFAQRQLFKQHQITTWDVRPEQLPEAYQAACRAAWLDDVDGKYKIPMQSQFRLLASLGDPLGQAFVREWPAMKPLLDAASHAVLGHGFEPIKTERVQQLYDTVVKLTGVPDSSLPKFPTVVL